MSDLFIDWLNRGADQDEELFEYRFLVSGLAYNGSLQGDVFRSSQGGVLLERPFSCVTLDLFEEHYPSEIAVCFRAGLVQGHESGGIRFRRVPHADIANDIACVLTLYFRRLVVCVGLASETIPERYRASTGGERLFHSIAGKARVAYYWPEIPATRVLDEVWINASPMVSVRPGDLADFFMRFGMHSHGEEIMDAVRMYHRAMECLFRQPDISYLLFVCAAEVVASKFTEKLSDEERLQRHGALAVQLVASKLGLDGSAIRELMLAASPGREKSKQTAFCEFLTENGKGHCDEPPLLFPDFLKRVPIAEEEKALRNAYSARSGYVHASRKIKSESLVGLSSMVPSEVFSLFLPGADVNSAPPITWIERIIAVSLKTVIMK